MAKQKKPAQKNKSKKPQRKYTAKSQAGAKTQVSLWFLLSRTLNVFVWLSLVITLILVWYAKDLPDIHGLEAGQRRPSVTLLDYQGQVIVTYGDLQGKPLKLSEMTPNLPKAVIAIEDGRFRQHFGVDLWGLTRAMIANIRAGRIVQGGSTLTQQLAKNLFLTPEKSIKRKIQELLLAFWLEYNFSKDQILQIYLNRVYLGAGTYGIDAAAFKYFGKSNRNLTLAESALIAGLLKAPSRYAPTNNPKLGWDRARVVLKRMYELDFINENQYEQAYDQINNRQAPEKRKGQSYRYFADWVLEELPYYVSHRNEDLIVETTFDPQIQAVAERAVDQKLQELKGRKVSEAAFVAMSPNGAVRAMIGGENYRKSQFNRGTQAVRQSSSLFKLYVYLAALEEGVSPNEMISDAPLTLGKWTPKNYGWQAQGEVPVSYGLIYSINTVTLRLAQMIGVNAIINTARRLGINRPIRKDFSIALGSAEMTLLELVSSYSVIANYGHRSRPHAILTVKNKAGDKLYSRSYTEDSVVDLSKLAQIKDMLRRVVEEGTGKRAKANVPSWGKTGTSQNHRDAWFVGFTNYLVAGVWLGNDDESPMDRIVGGRPCAEIWKNVVPLFG